MMLDAFLRNTQRPVAAAEPRRTEPKALAVGGLQS
jgi:hypothetical protein